MSTSAARLLPALIPGVIPGMIASALLLTAADGASAAPPAWEQNGQASWYGDGFHGRRTSSGQIFDQNAMTAAHPHLPLGSRVRVTLRDTGGSVVVTITDRQPPTPRRVIDLSRGAAARLGIVDRGVGMVRLVPADEPVEVAEAPEDRPSSRRPQNSARVEKVTPRP